MIEKLAVMTSGGDAPGMNAAIRAVVRRGLDSGLAVYGITNGYEGLVSGGDAIRQMAWHDVGGVLPEGGTFLGLSLIHISEPTRPRLVSRMPSSA